MSGGKSQLPPRIGVTNAVLSSSSKPPIFLDHQNIIQQCISDEEAESLEEIFDEIMLAARDDLVCQAIEKALRPIFASTHTLGWLHLENCDILYSPLFSVFAPTAGSLVAAGFKSRSAFRDAKGSSTAQITNRGGAVPPSKSLVMLPIFTRCSRGLVVVQFSRGRQCS
jgi:hypothetical protein